MKKHLLFISFTFLLLSILNAQNVGIGTNTPNASAQLDIQSSDKGLLIPRMSTLQRTSIVNPANGLQVYDTDKKSNWYWDGTKWNEFNQVIPKSYLYLQQRNTSLEENGYLLVGKGYEDGVILFHGDKPGSWVFSNLATNPDVSGSTNAVWSPAWNEICYYSNGTIKCINVSTNAVFTSSLCTVPGFDLNRTSCQIAIGNGYIFVVGGRKSGTNTTLKTCAMYHINTDAWYAMADLPNETERNGLVYTTDGLLCFGGGKLDIIGNYIPATVAYKFNITNNSWATAFNLPSAFSTGISDAVLFADLDRLYVAGGTTPLGASHNLHILDLATGNGLISWGLQINNGVSFTKDASGAYIWLALNAGTIPILARLNASNYNASPEYFPAPVNRSFPYVNQCLPSRLDANGHIIIYDHFSRNIYDYNPMGPVSPVWALTVGYQYYIYYKTP